jgi:hypothetical protein
VADDRLVYLNLNLPHTHLLFLPFTLVDLRLAAACWFLTGLLAVAVACHMVARETGWRPTPLWLLIFLWWMPTHVQAVTGQVAWIALPLVALAWRSARNERWGVAGVSIGVLVSFKPFLLPFVAWLAWRRHWRGVTGAMVGIAGVSAVGVMVFGADAYHSWSGVTASVDWYARSLNASLWGLIFRLFTANPQFAAFELAPPIVRVLLCIAVAAAIIACWRACRRTANLDVQWSAVMAASLLLSPLGWVYYGVWLLPGLGNAWPGVVSTFFWLVPVPWIFWGQPSAWWTAVIGSAATWGLVAAFAFILRSSFRDQYIHRSLAGVEQHERAR